MNSEKPTTVCPFIFQAKYCGRQVEIYLDHSEQYLLIGKRVTIKPGGNTHYVTIDGAFLHRLIMQPPDGYHVHHINHNGLDNRRCNLRVVNSTEHRIYHSSRYF